MMKDNNKWWLALLLVGVGVLIGLGIGQVFGRMSFARAAMVYPMSMSPAECAPGRQADPEECAQMRFMVPMMPPHVRPSAYSGAFGMFYPRMMFWQPGSGLFLLGLIALTIGLLLMWRNRPRSAGAAPPPPPAEGAPPSPPEIA